MAEIKERNDDDHDIGDGDDSRFRRRKLAGQNTTHDDYRDHQRDCGLLRRICELAEARALTLDSDWPEEVTVDHQSNANQNARDHAGQKQAADRDIAGRTIDDSHDARRYEV